jgi:phosphoglycerate dehydrogenase-like enzyme
LIAAIESGQVGFAALDVFETEPLPRLSPLWVLDNVIVSPHTAANSPGEERAIAELFADNATRLLDGRELRNRVDTVQFF